MPLRMLKPSRMLKWLPAILSLSILMLHGSFAHADISFAEFQNRLLKSRAPTVAAALTLLPKEYKTHYTLIKKSQSLQVSTPQNPRAILFGETGKTIFTFNGNSNHPGYFSIETVEASGDNLHFREIVFLAELPENLKSLDREDLPIALGLRPTEVKLITDQVLISNPNPAKCMGCHAVHLGTDSPYARYIWDSYPFWPTAYGSEDDSLSATEMGGDKTQPVDPKYLANADITDREAFNAANGRLTTHGKSLSKELGQFREFHSRRSNHPRYGKLLSPNEAYPFSSYKVLMTNIDGGFKVVGSYNPTSMTSGPRRLLYMPNTRLATLITANQAEVMKERILKNTTGMVRSQLISQMCRALTESVGVEAQIQEILSVRIDFPRLKNNFFSGVGRDLRQQAVLATLDFLEKEVNPENIERTGVAERDALNAGYLGRLIDARVANGLPSSYLKTIQGQFSAFEKGEQFKRGLCVNRN